MLSGGAMSRLGRADKVNDFDVGCLGECLHSQRQYTKTAMETVADPEALRDAIAKVLRSLSQRFGGPLYLQTVLVGSCREPRLPPGRPGVADGVVSGEHVADEHRVEMADVRDCGQIL